MLDKLTAFVTKYWNQLQTWLDVRGDVVMLVISGAYAFRIIYAAFGHVALNPSEAAVYASAIGAFAWSNKGGPNGQA
jgi:hypothetical protein